MRSSFASAQRRTIPLHQAYAAAPHGWSLPANQAKVGKVKESGKAVEAPPESSRARARVGRDKQPTRPYQHVPDEVLLEVFRYVTPEGDEDLRTRTSMQIDLHSFILVNRQWYAIGLPALYRYPVLEGAGYDRFVSSVCPSINLKVRKSPLAGLVQHLDLSQLVHQGSKSVTARLLGRTKANLQTFRAPQASFSLNCFPALSKCWQLESLDLSLVTEASSLRTIFDSVSNLPNLREFYLPRSKAFGASLAPDEISWPRDLQILGLSGGLDRSFWTGSFHFPPGLHEILITHCPKLDESLLLDFLWNNFADTSVYPGPEVTLLSKRPSIERMTFEHLPRLGPYALDPILGIVPSLTTLCVSLDYVSAEMFELSRSLIIPRLAGTGSGGVNRHTLMELILTDSGERDNGDKIEPMDILFAADEKAFLPCLRTVEVARSVGWETGETSEDLAGLHDWLLENAERMEGTGEEKFRRRPHDEYGLRIVGPFT